MICNRCRIMDFLISFLPPSIKDKVHQPKTSVWPYLIHWAQFLDRVCLVRTMKMGHSSIYLGLAILTIYGKYYVYWCQDNTFPSFTFTLNYSTLLQNNITALSKKDVNAIQCYACTNAVPGVQDWCSDKDELDSHKDDVISSVTDCGSIMTQCLYSKTRK